MYTRKIVGNLMEIRENSGRLFQNTVGNHQNHQNKQNHPKPSNLIEFQGNGRECPRATLPKTTKTTKTSKNNQNQHNHQHKLTNLIEIKRIDRGCQNHQNHQNKQQNKQNHQKPQNIMEIKGQGTGCPRRGGLPKTTRNTKTSKINRHH